MVARAQCNRSTVRRRLLLSVSVAATGFVGYGRGAYAQCAPQGGGTYQCSGLQTTTQTLNADTLTVTTQPGFSITTDAGPAFLLNSTTALNFTDDNGSTISGQDTAIGAQNTGSGALSITTTGDVAGTGEYGIGISAYNSGNGTDLTLEAANVTGVNVGIVAGNIGSGALAITATGDVTGTGDYGTGIAAYNGASGTDLTLEASNVIGGSNGIGTQNMGSGALSITTTGDVTGIGEYETGIYAYNGTNATDLTIEAANVTGGNYGIRTRNTGSGALSITATGDVAGNSFFSTGINAQNGADATDLTIEAAKITGGRYGILAANTGSGALSITATGDVAGSGSSGIYVVNSGTDLTVEATNVTGSSSGIYARSTGSGAFSISATGDVSGTYRYGIRASNSADGTDLTIEAANVTGGNSGINSRHLGSGALSITTTGDITGTGTFDAGISTYSSANGTDLTIEAVNVTGGGNGINSLHRGSGALSITATGDVTGTDAYSTGISAYNGADGTDLTIEAANVTSGFTGIDAYNTGSGALSITATGDVTGTGPIAKGIYAKNTSNATDLTIEAAKVTGSEYGISAFNSGSGALSVTATGDVVGNGTDGTGIFTYNSEDGTDLTIEVANVTGNRDGIKAQNSGSGALSITATGDVVGTGTDSTGISAYNSEYGTDLTIVATNVTGGEYGISASNGGKGALSITTTGDVTSTGDSDYGIGISAYNGADGTGLTIEAANVTGGEYGINARNSGSGALSVTATGDVVGTGIDSTGISADNSEDGTDLTIVAANVTGGEYGINARNSGSGALSVTTTGEVVGTDSTGIYANNSASGTDLTIVAANVTGGEYGINARNSGSGALSVTTTGDVTGNGDGDYSSGISASNDAYGTDLTIVAANVTGGEYGINAFNSGSGALSVTATGDVTGNGDGDYSTGISASNDAYGTDLTIVVANVTGGEYGIYVRTAGKGALSITTTGDVTGAGDFGSGIVARSDANGTNLTIEATKVTGGREGITAYNGGKGVLSITTTGDVTGNGDDNYSSGIYANNSASGTDLTIVAAKVTGGGYGIYASNSGKGALSVTAAGDVTGTGTGDGEYSSGISANNSAFGTDLTIVAAKVTGGEYGIKARNVGSGALSITATGDVTGNGDGDYSSGISANNSVIGTDLTIVAAKVTGSEYGINAYNNGTGALSVTATGDVTGTNSSGIYADNSEYGTDLTVEANTVTGGDEGIYASNSGKGALSITTTGNVTGTDYDGISASNSASGTDLTIVANTVTGGDEGIAASNEGSGALSITTTGDVTGTGTGPGTQGTPGISVGILASNSSAGTDLTVAAVNAAGDSYGIFTRNYGSGALSITATGDVVGTKVDGIYSQSEGTDLTIAANAVNAARYGINARNNGSGATSITTTGDVVGAGGAGIVAVNSGDSTGVTIVANTATGAGYGIGARNYGAGAVSITTTGDVSGGLYGIGADNSGDGGISIAATGDVASATTGIGARNRGTGAISITTTGDVSGARADGIYAGNLGGGAISITARGNVTGGTNGIRSGNAGGGATTTITVESGATVKGGTGAAILDFADAGSGNETTVVAFGTIIGDIKLNAGDDGFEFRPGAVVTGTVDGGDGTDSFRLAGPSMTNGVDAAFDLGQFDLDNDGSAPSGNVGATGFENFTKTGTSSFRLTGTNGETGTLSLQEGEIVASGAFPGLAVESSAQGLLTGTGTIGSLRTSGTVSPGQPDQTGTLNVAGDVSFENGATFDATVESGASDLLAAGGAVSIDQGADVNLNVRTQVLDLPLNGITIVTAGEGVSGAFGSVRDDLPDLDFIPVSEPNAVRLAYSVASNAPLTSPLLTSPKEGSSVALRGAQTANLSLARSLREQADVRGSAFPGAGVLSALPQGEETQGDDRGTGVFSTSIDMKSDATGTGHTGNGIVGGVFGASTDMDADGTGIGYETNVAGFYAGPMGRFEVGRGRLATGLVVGRTEGDASTTNTDGDTEAWHLALFTAYEDGPLRLDGSVAAAMVDYDLKRTPVAGVTARGKTDGTAVAFSAGASYDVAALLPAMPHTVALRPFVGLDVASARYDGYTETGAGILNLTVDGDNATTAFARVGVELSSTVDVLGGTLGTSLSLGYERAFGDLDTATRSSLTNIGGAFFDPIADIDEDRFLLGAEIGFGIDKVTGFARYDGALGDRLEDHQASIGLRVQF